MIFTKRVIIFAGLLITILSHGISFGQCQGNNGLAVVQAYSYVFSFPDQLSNLVQNNRLFYQSNGPAIHCGGRFVNALNQAALNCPSYNEIYNQAVQIAGHHNLPHMGPGLANDMYRHCTDLSLLARYIGELNTVLPALANGNPQPYYNSYIYQLSATLLNGMQGLLLPAHFQSIRQMTYDMNMWFVGRLMQTVH